MSHQSWLGLAETLYIKCQVFCFEFLLFLLVNSYKGIWLL